MRNRPPPSTRPAEPQHEAYLKMPNGSAVYEQDSKRLKGYVHGKGPKLGSGVQIAYDARGALLGEGSMAECMNLLSTPKAVAVASAVYVEDAPKRKRG